MPNRAGVEIRDAVSEEARIDMLILVALAQSYKLCKTPAQQRDTLRKALKDFCKSGANQTEILLEAIWTIANKETIG